MGNQTAGKIRKGKYVFHQISHVCENILSIVYFALLETLGKTAWSTFTGPVSSIVDIVVEIVHSRADAAAGLSLNSSLA